MPTKLKSFRAKTEHLKKVSKKTRGSSVPVDDVAPVGAPSTNLPLRVGAELVNLARTAGELADRSATAQLEHWAKIGRAVESVLSGASVAKLKQINRVPDIGAIVRFSQTLEGREKAEKIISRSGLPTYGTDPRFPGFIMQYQPAGGVRKGHFVNRKFVPAD